MSPAANNEYTVGWICALSLEMAASRGMLDENHGKPLEQHPNDKNSYHLGNIGRHNIVIACLPGGIYGTTSAAIVAEHMLLSFPSVRFGLMVGIGGGIPSKAHDIRLGDVVVSKPDRTFGGVFLHDFGKIVGDGKLERTGSLNKSPSVLLNALSSLEAEYELHGGGKIPDYLADMFQRYTAAKFKADYSYQGAENDQLYDADYDHVGDGDTCQSCNPAKVVARSTRENDIPVVHAGTIASGDKVIKSAKIRDTIGQEYGALCFEMEAAGLMDNFPCIVIRGICDYSDSHKNKSWQRYAAATAAAYAKEILGEITPQAVKTTPTVAEVLRG
jgi:nucleoside phosphorylase